jgi:hypothetical protein
MDIDKYGWAVQLVGAGETDPPFAYSIGMWKTLRQPEILVFGLRFELMGYLVNAAGNLAKQTGQALPLHTRVPDILSGVDIEFRAVAPEAAADYIHQAERYYRDVHKEGPPPVLQLIYPDQQNRFPGEPGVHPGLAKQQPLLAERPAAPR